MQFLVVARDGTDRHAAARRAAVRDAHIERAKAMEGSDDLALAITEAARGEPIVEEGVAFARSLMDPGGDGALQRLPKGTAVIVGDPCTELDHFL